MGEAKTSVYGGTDGAMKILYVARHNCGDNDDEGAIAHALMQLGHEVHLMHEKPRHRLGRSPLENRADFCLFHKWPDPFEISHMRIPCVFWYFDLVWSDDPTLKARAHSRVEWMKAVIPSCVLGFCTDGDWVANDRTGKLRHLMQGMDERVAGYGQPIGDYPPILFAGMVNHGQSRASHIEQLDERYRLKLKILGDGGPHHRRHGRALADIFASTKIVIAPDGPNSARYWSNRVYLTTGLGGFLLHPYCRELEKHYQPHELVYYHTREQCNDLIDFYLTHDEERERFRHAGYERTMRDHTYRHRCAELIRQVQEVL